MSRPTTVTSPGDWARKARELDRFRWKLLRERHGRLGSLLRLARDSALDLAWGMYASMRLRRLAETTPCEVLMLHAACKSMALQRKNVLIDALRLRGRHVLEEALRSPAEACKRRMLLAPPQSVPLRYLAYAAHAQWLVERYSPTVLVNERNGSLHAPFLRLALAAKGAQLLHLAHATTVESSRRLAMNDYDYYGVFGHSSLQALQQRRLRFGQSCVVLVGSYLADTTYELPVAEPTLATLLILGVGPDREKEAGYQRTYRLLADWAGHNPGYRVLFKRHPRSRAAFWLEAADRLENVSVLETTCTLAQALAQCSIVINIMSNAGIEAGLAGRPVIYANAGTDRDIFSHDRFFGAAVESGETLSIRVREITADYQRHVQQARGFADFHLVHGVHGLEKTVQLVGLLCSGEDPADHFKVFELPPAE